MAEQASNVRLLQPGLPTCIGNGRRRQAGALRPSCHVSQQVAGPWSMFLGPRPATWSVRRHKRDCFVRRRVKICLCFCRLGLPTGHAAEQLKREQGRGEWGLRGDFMRGCGIEMQNALTLSVCWKDVHVEMAFTLKKKVHQKIQSMQRKERIGTKACSECTRHTGSAKDLFAEDIVGK